MHKALALSVVAFAPAALAQNLVFNGGFEQPVLDGGWIQRQPGETFGGWTVDTGEDTMGIAQVGLFGNPLAAEGVQSVELNFYLQGGISQAIPTSPGQTYDISFLMAGQTNAGPDVKRMRVDWEGREVATLTWSLSQSGGAWQAHTLRVTATTTPSVLHFRGLEVVDGGPYLDAVAATTAGCAADFNGDGFLDFFDYDDYVNCFENAACPPGRTADFNGDDFADFFDYDDFVSAFETGC